MEETSKTILKIYKEYTQTEENIVLESADNTSAGLLIKIPSTTMNIQEAYDKFKDITQFKLCNDNLSPYGIYSNLVFISTAINADESISVLFKVSTVDEIRLWNLEQAVQEHDLALASSIYGQIEEESTDE